MSAQIPRIVTLKQKTSARAGYDNRPIAQTNDHLVRISVMTAPYFWHFHPNSDETFLVVEGRLAIEFRDGCVELDPGQLVTVPRGMHHRTYPIGERSVNLTFESAQTETVVV